MQITDILAQVGGLQSVARELNISESEAARGAEALAPAILGGFQKQAQQLPTGLDGLGGLLSQLGGGDLFDEVLAEHPTDVSRGNDVLGQIFGSKDVSRAVAQNAAGKTGLNPSLLKKMLPLLAMLVAGYMAKRKAAAGQTGASGGGLGDLLGGLLGGRVGSAQSAQPGLGSLLDQDGDGNPLDDILRMAGKVLR